MSHMLFPSPNLIDIDADIDNIDIDRYEWLTWQRSAELKSFEKIPGDSNPGLILYSCKNDPA